MPVERKISLQNFFPFLGRRYRIGIFGHRAVKIYNKFWRETFGTIGAEFRRKILSPCKNSRILPIRSEVPVCHSALCRVPFWPFGILHQWCVKFFCSTFSPFLGRKYRIGIFWHRTVNCITNFKEKLSAPLVQSSMGKYSVQVKILEFYPSGLRSRCGTLHSAELPFRPFGTLHQWHVKFLCTTFSPFLDRKYRIGIFVYRTVKMYNKFWRETFGSIGAKFQRKILSLGHNFRILPICT